MKQPLLTILLACAAMGSANAETSRDEIVSALTVIRDLERPARINLATFWDGNKYVQCRRTLDSTTACEAAGTLMQPSLSRVLTAPRTERLTTLGWRLDLSFGNYTRTFGPAATVDAIADEVSAALEQGYDADVKKLSVETTDVVREPCPPRNGPTQNLAGMISDAPSMAKTAVHACSYHPEADAAPRKLGPQSTATDLIAVYGSRVATEIRRLRVNRHRWVFAAFQAGLGYIQCAPKAESNDIYCEAQSADSWPELATVLTPARIERLHAAGFADPGRSPNYARSYAADAMGDAALAAEILTLLHDVYGYYGGSKLEVATERG